MVNLGELEAYCNQLLAVDSFNDYCPNGLQVDGGNPEISSVVTGVTASQALLDAAVEAGADLLLVHHGYFWKGESPALTGMKGRRVRTLMQNGISLMAYHLPLDAHAEIGNNRQLADRLGFQDPEPLDEEGLLWSACLGEPESAQNMIARIDASLQRNPLYLDGGREDISKVCWCTGGAQGYIERAAAAGMDAFISGEVSEQTAHLARELGIHYFSAGHHATERYGILALGEHLSERFGLQCSFIDISNPV
ncbi:Nif3-like dinuclear metal center hexameric protein [Solemya velesiana gill symbiont]|uniref:GTP cyclohydrolase 1 type 2 homolog n=1 Tax=Solemya velesiana gill symbiont TaxID=1918948 RepID=A0A1T2KX68_9GAMM|nr:Nif3-like dinuclear metal center hexameric protein [Solemya velesiana gill symbiont]OOZ37422.1 Nif3-like dinuclear metal center hexameric protein [Solemya velesiana gill symbiont]